MTLEGNVDYYLEKILCVILKFKVFFHVFNTRGKLGKFLVLSPEKLMGTFPIDNVDCMPCHSFKNSWLKIHLKFQAYLLFWAHFREYFPTSCG